MAGTSQRVLTRGQSRIRYNLSKINGRLFLRPYRSCPLPYTIYVLPEVPMMANNDMTISIEPRDQPVHPLPPQDGGEPVRVRVTTGSFRIWSPIALRNRTSTGSAIHHAVHPSCKRMRRALVLRSTRLSALSIFCTFPPRV